MVRFTKVAAALAATLVFTVGMSPGAGATEDTSPTAEELEVAYMTFDSTVVAVAATSVIDQDDPTVITQPPTDDPAGTDPTVPTVGDTLSGSNVRCQKVTGTVTAKNYYNQELWKFQQWVSWCFNGTKITSKDSGYNVSCCYTGWSFDGINSNNGDTSMYPQRFQKTRQGKFSHCGYSPWGSPCTYKYPWVQTTVYGTGSYSNNGGTGTPPS